MSRSLERALQRFRTPPADGDPDGSGGRVDVAGRVSTAAFRAAIKERMRTVERDMGDIKNRVNGLIFLVAGAVITQLLVRVLAW
ncbi:MAG: hypothetical protein IIA90_04775 [Chloroflexi bacterium]|nr:hypothetical protein [Chloroflexota bacterium]